MFALKMWDLDQMKLLPPDWQAAVTALAGSAAVKTVLDGRSSTSREPANIQPIEVSVVMGDAIQKNLPWLYQAYAGAFREMSSQLYNRPLIPAQDITSSININVVSGFGSRYERHVDSNPVTGLLYASTLREEDGGALVFDHPNGSSDLIYPRAGLFIAFDATTTPHYVAPLKSKTPRLSIPMNYYFPEVGQQRPADLDGYLYTKQ